MIASAFASGVIAVALGLVFVFVAFLPVFCLIDAISRPSTAFRAVGSSKALWVVLLIWLNLFASIVYLASVRPKLEAAKAPL